MPASMTATALVPPYRESGRELSRAGLYALGVHLACVLLLAAGLYSAPPPPFEPVGEPIEAELISLPTQVKPAPARPQPRPQPPRPVVPPPSAPKPETTPASRPEDVTDLKPPAPPVAEPDPLVTGPDPAVERRRREDLAVEGALEGDPRKVYHAVLMDPLTSAVLSLREIRAMVDEMFEQNRDWLPQFR